MYIFNKITRPALIVSFLLITACSWVKLLPEAESVRVLTEVEPANCEKKGQATVSLKASIIGIKRGTKQVRKELIILGKNSAVNIGGNVIVSASEIVEGKQTFDIYVCK